jgi:hypothetical protein
MLGDTLEPSHPTTRFKDGAPSFAELHNLPDTILWLFSAAPVRNPDESHARLVAG